MSIDTPEARRGGQAVSVRPGPTGRCQCGNCRAATASRRYDARMTKRATLLACVVVNGLLTVGVLQYVSAHGGSPGIAFVEAMQACLGRHYGALRAGQCSAGHPGLMIFTRKKRMPPSTSSALRREDFDG